MTHLLSTEQIIEMAQHYAHRCGIYFLIDDLRHEIVYVGQSVDILARIAQHTHGGIEFAQFSFIECTPEELTDLETEYIVRLNPIFNTNLPAYDKWTTFTALHRKCLKQGIEINQLRKYIADNGIVPTNDYWFMSEFEALLTPAP